MQATRKKKIGRLPRCTHSAVLACGVLGAAGAVHAEVEIEPRISSAVTWTDNIDLGTDQEANESEEIAQIDPGLRITQTAQRVNSYLDYTMQNLFFMGDSDRNKTYHSLDGSTMVEAIRDWFYVEAAVILSQQLVDPSRPVNNELIFNNENVADVKSARITPSLRHHFSAADFEARYTRAKVKYSGLDSNGTPLEDADVDSGRVALTSPDEDARFTWGASYDVQRASYDISPDFEYETARLDAGLAVSSTLRLLLSGGLDSDFEENPRGGGLGQSFVQGGFRYRPDSLNEIEVLVGQRFDRTSYEGHWTREGRQLHWSLNYYERPTTEAEQLALRPVGGTGGIDMPRNPLPDSSDFARLTSEVFLDRNLNAELVLLGRRTELTLSVEQTRRIYLSSGQNEEGLQASISLLRRLSSRTDLLGSVSRNQGTLRGNGDYEDMIYRLGLTRTLSETFKLSLMGAHVDRHGNVGDYKANWITLRLDAVF